jgi:(4-(4-[2-(gamma-L-glutamylamino)ethyl]phenoxymethyl)furan-2-yl)methanamine synthase
LSKRGRSLYGQTMNWLALDIGGANVKAADGQGYARSYAFAMWRESAVLAQQIRAAISEAPRSDHLAVTMTGELADCFASKEAGIQFILQAVSAGSDNRHTRVYLVDGRLVSPQVALTAPHLVAASNWHALARFAGRHAPTGPALLIDVGSTTCDVIPLVDGKPVAKGKTDTQRLLTGELVYTGVERSPVCAVAQVAPYRGQSCPLVHEVFATMRDVYLILEQIADDPADLHTSDGKPATRAAARVRLGRMVAADTHEFNHRDAVALAHGVGDTQAARLASAIGQVSGSLPAWPRAIILSGHGEFLAQAALATFKTAVPTVSLTKELGSTVSRCAPAHALAVLAREITGT